MKKVMRAFRLRGAVFAFPDECGSKAGQSPVRPFNQTNEALTMNTKARVKTSGFATRPKAI